MDIPKKEIDRLQFYREVGDACLASRHNRLQQYANNERYYMYGTGEGNQSPWNNLYAHLDTVTSFLYASDSTRFSWKLQSLAPATDLKKTDAASRRVNEEWKGSNADMIAQLAVLFALVYDSTIVKLIRRRGGKVEPFFVHPGDFGVYNERIPMIDRQEAFCHVWYQTKSDLERRLLYHPKKAQILKDVTEDQGTRDTSTQMPPLMTQVILSSNATPTNGMESVTGQPNINLNTPPLYDAQVEVPEIEMHELWVWDDELEDYQTVTMASGNVVIYDRPNIFLPRKQTGFSEGEHPFIQVCPNPLPKYFWGNAEVQRLAPLQDRLNLRMDSIERLLAKQVDPPTAFFGMGLVEEKVSAFDMPGSFIAGGDPSAKLQSFQPTIPADIYSDVKFVMDMFDTVSGLTNVTKGQGEAGVRSAGHAGKLLTVGSARPKKRALIIEDSLEKIATLYGKCIYVGDEDELTDENGHKFVVAQMSPHFTVEVDAHSNSPVFMENQKEDAALLFKAKAINRKRLIQMTHPPMQDELIRDLETKIIPAERAAAEANVAAEAAKAQAQAASKGGGKPDLQAVK